MWPHLLRIYTITISATIFSEKLNNSKPAYLVAGDNADIPLWLGNDPAKSLTVHMPLTKQMGTDLCTVDESDLDNLGMIKNQTQAHTFTYTRRGEQSRRLSIPLCPMHIPRVLMPMHIPEF